MLNSVVVKKTRVYHRFWINGVPQKRYSLVVIGDHKTQHIDITISTTTTMLLSQMRRVQPAARAMARSATRASFPGAKNVRFDSKFSALQLVVPATSSGATFGGSHRAFSSSPLVSGCVFVPVSSWTVLEMPVH